MLSVVVQVLSLALTRMPVQNPDEPLPETVRTTDGGLEEVVWRKPGEVRQRVTRGTIGDISGGSVVMKRGADRLDVIPLREVLRLKWNAPPAFDAGLQQLRTSDFAAAERSFEQAQLQESRDWAVREILAMKARTLVMTRRAEAAVDVVEKIYRSDPNTRHLVELPLVWDERIPVGQRPPFTVADLDHPSVLRRLVAASVLLDDPQAQTAAVTVLRTLLKAPQLRVQQLAERQSWRLDLLTPGAFDRFKLTHRAALVQADDQRLRAIGELILGRAWLQQGDFDRAVSSLLRVPLLEPLDPATTRLAGDDAVAALQHAGFLDEAEALRTELDSRSPFDPVPGPAPGTP